MSKLMTPTKTPDTAMIIYVGILYIMNTEYNLLPCYTIVAWVSQIIAHYNIN